MEVEMVKFIDVDPSDVPNLREAHRGRVSYPILKSFLETNKSLVMLDRTGIQQSLQNLTTTLSSYIRSHELPVKLFTRRGEVYLMRTDVDEKTGEVLNKDVTVGPTNNSTGKYEGVDDDSIPDLDSDEVDRRFKVERHQTTK
jgi:hypothetical protein